MYTNTCATKKCGKPIRASGYCKNHYHSEVFLKRRPLYNTWCNMLRRCNDPSHPRYKDWGGRGIKVCERWQRSYTDFARDMGQRPSRDHTLDRIDNNGDYEPSNVRWTTASRQSFNRRVRNTNSTGVSGVCWNKRIGRYQATITVNKKREHLGWFKDLDDAISARRRAEVRYSN